MEITTDKDGLVQLVEQGCTAGFGFCSDFNKYFTAAWNDAERIFQREDAIPLFTALLAELTRHVKDGHG